ncbi:MAG: transcriptional regulator [Spirochaetota bacterium]
MDEGRFAYDDLDGMFHSVARLRVTTALQVHPRGVTFVELKRLCDLSDGNLSRHLQKLQGEGIVEMEKSFVNRSPQTTVRLTKEGRRRFRAYLAALERVIEDAEASEAHAPSREKGSTGFRTQDLRGAEGSI